MQVQAVVCHAKFTELYFLISFKKSFIYQRRKGEVGRKDQSTVLAHDKASGWTQHTTLEGQRLIHCATDVLCSFSFSVFHPLPEEKKKENKELKILIGLSLGPSAQGPGAGKQEADDKGDTQLQN